MNWNRIFKFIGYFIGIAALAWLLIYFTYITILVIMLGIVIYVCIRIANHDKRERHKTGAYPDL